MHRTLSPLLALPHLLGQRVGFITARARNRFGWLPHRFLRHLAYAQYKHWGMALHVLRDRKADMFVIFEHKADYSFLLYLAFLLKRRPVFFFVHDMQQVANTTTRCWLALQMCRAWVRLGEFYPMYIARGDDALPPSRRFPAEKSLVVPHPHHLAENPPPPRPLRVAGARFRVGLIGTVRKEKPIRHLLEILLRARGELDFQLVVGTPRATTPPWLETLDLEIMDTTTEAQYSACLSSLDIFVVDFVQAEYFFRPSGAVIDAGMNGCYVICPDYLVFQAQISDPVSIGRTFQTVEEIPRLLKEAMQQLALGPIDTATWRRYHRAENIAARMRAFLEQRATRRALPAYRKAVAK